MPAFETSRDTAVRHGRGTAAWWLGLVLRILAVGVSLRLALLLAPRGWLERLVPASGLGPYPEGLAMDYLLRTTSVAYFLGGLFCWAVARDLPRNKLWAQFLAWSTLVFGVVLAVPDWLFGGAVEWQVGLGVGTILLGVLMLVLAARIEAQHAVADAPVPPDQGQLLRVFLRVAGVFAAMGIVGVLVPQPVLVRAVTAIDPGAVPERPMAPVMVVLLRSLFGTSVLGGVFFWLISSNLTRHAWVARFLGWASIFFGAIVTLTDLGSGLPWWLRLVSPLALVFGAIVVVLARRSPGSCPAGKSDDRPL
jgi:hypothetical protein